MATRRIAKRQKSKSAKISVNKNISLKAAKTAATTIVNAADSGYRGLCDRTKSVMALDLWKRIKEEAESITKLQEAFVKAVEDKNGQAANKAKAQLSVKSAALHGAASSLSSHLSTLPNLPITIGLPTHIRNRLADDIRKLRNEFAEVSLDEISRTLKVTTKPIDILYQRKTHHLGQFVIKLDLGSFLYSVSPKGHNQTLEDGYYHPHVSTAGRLCEGDGGTAIANARANRDIYQILLLIKTVLSNYGGSPYHDISYWYNPVGRFTCCCGRKTHQTCSRCNHGWCGWCRDGVEELVALNLHDDDENIVGVCNRCTTSCITCKCRYGNTSEIARKCYVCKCNVCSSCSSPCAVCGVAMCEDCQDAPCDRCNNVVCSKKGCLKNGLCRICRSRSPASAGSSA